MKIIKFFSIQCTLIGVYVLSFFTSCSPEIYNANALNVPLLAQKGNAKVSLGITASGEGVGLYNTNLQGAYAISDHIGIMLNGMYHNYTRTYTPFLSNTPRTDRHKEGFFEAGLGYFGPVGNSTKWRGEIYSGWGMGRSKETNPNSNEALLLESPYNRLFLQPSIGFVSRYFDAALSSRVSYLSVGKINWVGNTSNGKILRGATFEPCLTLRVGYNKFKPFMQYSWLFYDDELLPAVAIEGLVSKLFTVQIGISLNLNEVYQN